MKSFSRQYGSRKGKQKSYNLLLVFQYMIKIELDKTRLKDFYKLMILASITLFGIFFGGWLNYKNILLLICAIIWFLLFLLFVFLLITKKKPKFPEWVIKIIKSKKIRFKRPPFLF